MKKWLIASLLLNAVFLASAITVAFVGRDIFADFLRTRTVRLTSQFEALPPATERIVFLGDSITAGGLWEELLGEPQILNRGIGGDTTAQLVERAAGIHALAPRKLFVMIGINDLNGGVSQEETFENLKTLFDGFDREIPDTEIFLQSTLPVNDDWRIPIDPADVDAINDRLQREADTRGYTFLDLRPRFSDDDGELRHDLSNDGIHLLGPGYIVWRDELRRRAVVP